MVDLNRILCPVDFSDGSRRALEYAAAIARWYESTLVVFHVYSPYPVPVMGSELAGYATPPLPVRAEDVMEDVRRFCGPLAAADTQILVRQGYAVAEIVEQAGRMPAELRDLGTHGRSGFERLFLGSVTEKVLRQVRCPVLTVPPPLERAAGGAVLFKTILCAVDFSPPSVRALEYGLSLAREADARVLLLHVNEWSDEDALAAVALHDSVSEYRRRTNEEALERLEDLIPPDARTWCTPEPVVTSGRVYREILRAADESGAEIIVMGVQGRGAVDLALFGSTTNQVIRAASCAVLTLRS